MKTLSIRQPFAFKIMKGQKTIECRSWGTQYRGPLAIHASSKKCADQPDLPTGMVLGVVDLVDVVESRPKHAKGACAKSLKAGECWCWILANPRPIAKPFVAKGQAAIFYVDVPAGQ
jgi:hypothetical protein